MPMKITDEIRGKLRIPLPDEAVSPHPTKTYLSTIKSIYVAERINDVFGVGSWTLKGEPIEMLEKVIVMRVVLEIPEYGFYGEAYGGNDNADRGDAFKGAVTDGFTKIAAQQLEIGIDVFKGLSGTAPSKAKETLSGDPLILPAEHWCEEHNCAYELKTGKFGSFYAHKTEDGWCNEKKKKEAKPEAQASITPSEAPTSASEGYAPGQLFAWLAENMNWPNTSSARTWIVNVCKIPEDKIDSDPEGCKQEIAQRQGWTI